MESVYLLPEGAEGTPERAPEHQCPRSYTHGPRAASDPPPRSPPHDRFADRGSTVRRRAGGLGRPAADTPVGVTRLWENQTPRADSETLVWVENIDYFRFCQFVRLVPVSQPAINSRLTSCHFNGLQVSLQTRCPRCGGCASLRIFKLPTRFVCRLLVFR